MSRQSLRPLFVALFSALLTVTLVANNPDASATADATTGRPDQAVLTIGAEDDGAALRSVGNGYLSPATEADSPFTHMLLRWEGSEPVTGTLTLEVRASTDNQTWTQWILVPQDPDLWLPEDGDEVYWSQVIYAGEDARFWQVRASLLPGPDGQRAELRQIEVNTVDARFGDTAPQSERPAATRDASLANIAKPSVVSRSAWGSPDGQGSRVNPVYYPVNHMVVHHTADANSLTGREQNWADRVRAIWSFHTFTRGWGDVGYNFLIDPNGVVYEGRSGGDDAVSFHDTANYGSMGVVVIGTYASVDPTPVSQDSLVNLLSWKAAQKGIDPLGRSYYYGCDISRYCRPFTSGAVIPNIAGHRQVTPGHTTCPGDRLLNTLPAIRNRVKARISSGGGSPFRPDNGDLLIDELEQDAFAYSEANWYSAACGYGGHTFYSYATDTQLQSTNSATWRPNIPEDGTYRLYAHIPQGCGLGSPPYASTKAKYRIHTAEGDFSREVDHNTAEEWVDLGVYRFNKGTDGAVELDDFTGDPFSNRRVIFFDSIKWVPETRVQVDLLNVAYDRTTVAAGELLKVTFTVRNSSDVAIYGQAPQAGTRPQGGYEPSNGYVYDENECFGGVEGQDYPAYPKETDRFRVMLGPTNRSVRCDEEVGSYPWRWGVNGALEPGETRDIIGYVRFREPGTVNLHAGVIQEYVDYHAKDAATTTITVEPENRAPLPVAYDTRLRPLAHVYELGDMPDNFLARTRNPMSITSGRYIGSFTWDGSTLDWGDGGPFDRNDAFLVEQTRLFRASRSGTYTFRITSDDGSWLWVNGQPVIINHGLHSTTDMTGTVQLDAGLHVLSFKYFERTGLATAGYAVQTPDATSFTAPLDGLSEGARRFGGTFIDTPSLIIGADDLGGSGLNYLRYSWDGTTWFESSGGLLELGRLVPGNYRLRYQAVDAEGNASAVQELTFDVNPNLEIYEIHTPLVNTE